MIVFHMDNYIWQAQELPILHAWVTVLRIEWLEQEVLFDNKIYEKKIIIFCFYVCIMSYIILNLIHVCECKK